MGIGSADGPVENLNETFRTQPALLTASVAIWRVWQNWSKTTCKLTLSHSLAIFCTMWLRVLSILKAIKLVELRGQLMRKRFLRALVQCTPSSVWMMKRLLKRVKKRHKTGCVSVNFNSPGQIYFVAE